jgi:tRNA dimethylallyltransferase
VVGIVGPTATGKTRIAIELAQQTGAEIVSVDSMQLYRGMDIGTAKPSLEERAAIPHHLFDVADPAEDGFSVDSWLALAEESVRTIRRRGRVPILAGGTNLYVQAFLEGLFEGPEPDPRLRAELEGLDPNVRRRRLEEADPAAAERIHPNDVKRTIRALEVHALTGRRLSDLQQQWGRGRCRDDVVIVGLDWPVEAINRRINARVRVMIEAGLVDEVRRLLAAGRLGRQAREALGYRQIADYLEGRLGLEEAVEQIKIRTRRFAKQQRTWLRRFRAISRSTWIPAADLTPQELVDKALTSIFRLAPRGAEPPAAGLGRDGVSSALP